MRRRNITLVNARRALIAQAREAIDLHAFGAVRWDEIRQDNPEPLMMPDGRPDPVRKRERVILRFGEFVIDIASSEEAPPLGRVKLYKGEAVCVDGVLDAKVWARVGSTIRESGNGRRE